MGVPDKPQQGPTSKRAPGTRRTNRRVSRPAAEGVEPEPLDPPTEPRERGENDDRLVEDVPPHWK